MSATSEVYSRSPPTEDSPNNYPPAGQEKETTSEGGYGGHAFTQAAQRGLIDQSTEGIPLGDEIQDAYQGKDAETTAQYEHEQGQRLNPYGKIAVEEADVQEDRLAGSYTEESARKHEGGTIGSKGFRADTLL